MSIRWVKMVSEVSQAHFAADEGFESVYLDGNALAVLPSAEIEVAADRLQSSGMTGFVCSMPLPPEVRVTEKGFNLYMWAEHVRKGIRAAAAIGCSDLAWSEGRARVLPWEGEVYQLKEQLLQFLWILCDTCSEHNMRVLIEPLGPRRTNFLNSMEETADFVRLINKENVAALTSLREVSEIGLDEERFRRFQDLIGMVHLENPLSIEGPRLSPRENDGYDYRPFMSVLKQSAFTGPVVLPSDSNADALRYCRGIWDSL